MKIIFQKIRFVEKVSIVTLILFCLFFSQKVIASNEGVLYFTDAYASQGAVYALKNNTESTFYKRNGGRIYNLAFAPDGILYYSNSNDHNIYKLEENVETLVYTHTTWTRNLDFDNGGILYFSEASGSGGDGYIYKLIDGVATLYYTVKLSDVGAWIGNFTFDPNNNLFLSSGNRPGSKIYQVVDEIPQIVFSIPLDECCIAGISFDSNGTLFYASWSGGNIYKVDIPTQERQLFYSNPNYTLLSDVWVEGTLSDVSSFNDSDKDGIIDQWDECPDTLSDSPVYSNGCPAIKGDFDGNGKLEIGDCIGILQTLTNIRTDQNY